MSNENAILDAVALPDSSVNQRSSMTGAESFTGANTYRLTQLIYQWPDLFSVLINAVDTPLAILDPQGKIFMVNLAYKTFSEPLFEIGKDGFFWDLFPPKEKDKLMTAIFNESNENRAPSRQEFRLHTKDETLQYISCKFFALYDGLESLAFIICTINDITAQRQLQGSLYKASGQLNIERATLGKKEIAISEIMNNLEKEKRQVALDCQSNVDRLVMPILRRLRQQISNEHIDYLDSLEKSLDEITSPLIPRLEKYNAKLSPREYEICKMICEGMTSKQIAAILCISEDTVRTQRKAIRKKLRISGKKTNLRIKLQSLC